MAKIDLNVEIQRCLREMRELRHDLHAHPELGYEEDRTAGKVISYFEGKGGLEIESGIAGTGVTVTIGKELPGPAVALRADMDALPIDEATGVAYASKNPGKMHACGHDGHTAILMGVGGILAECREQLKGPVKLIFQPAEEGGAGGRRMCEAGVLDSPKIEAIFGLHNMPARETHAGQIALCPGAAMAGTGVFDLEILGKGGHAAFPHECIDPVVVGSEIVGNLQTLVSRASNPLAPAVISVTQFHAGFTYNVIPSSAKLAGTFRALESGVLEMLQAEIPRRARTVAEGYGATLDVNCRIGYPVLENHPRTDELFRRVVTEMGRGDDFVQANPIMGGEDFAFYLQHIPGTFWFLPSRPKERESVPFCHHPEFDFNDEVLEDGIRVTVELALRFAELW